MHLFIGISDNAQLVLIVVGFVLIALVIWLALALVVWVGRKILRRSRRARRAALRFDAADDAYEEQVSPEEKFAVDVDLQERMRGHSPGTR